MRITRKGQALLIDFEGDQEARRLYNNMAFEGFGIPHLPYRGKGKRLYGLTVFSPLTTERHVNKIYAFIEEEKEVHITISNQAKTIFKKYLKGEEQKKWDSMKYIKLM